MKKIYRTIAALALTAVIAAGAASCSGEQKEKATPARPTAAKTAAALPNYRYVDLDTILSRYNLAKDYNEEMLRLQNNAESQMKQHQNRIQSLGSQMENKMQNNGYLSGASLRRDQQKLASLQNDAQRSMASLQDNIAQAAAQAQKTINDSINAFIETYNKTRGYDAILFKAATLYINPQLDITDEVVEGLNARYNKVKK